ncbi:N-acetylmuramoyl-L-alanine amidase [Alphaproteobacteria bacterium]|nr:N-acetylmuramoyl-L-alanine amidase [Alphaproteobacteria bacterium]
MFFIIIFTNGVKSDELKTNCVLKFDSLVCINHRLTNNIKVNLQDDPYRIIIDFKKPINFNNQSKINQSKNILFKDVRLNSKLSASSRLVLELSQPAIISNFFFNKVKNNNKIINFEITLTKTSITSFSIAKHVLSKNKGNFLSLNGEIDLIESDRQISLEQRKFSNFPIQIDKNDKNLNSKKIFIVFIDPGHGGKDPGAIGTLGTLEKDLTLKASFLLAEALNKNNKINALLSRTGDYFLPLRERTRLAKKNKADIFVSIHADSSKNKIAAGISVFSLSDRASDKEAQILAKRENDVDNILGVQKKIKDPFVYGSLIKMFQREAMNDSSFLAKKIISNLKKTKLALNRGHRFAGFAVLKSYEIPSVLIEIGFLSNKEEEKKMLNNEYMNDLSKGLAKAIENYLFDKNR